MIQVGILGGTGYTGVELLRLLAVHPQVELRVTRTALINARSAAVDARLARVRAEIDLARLDGRAPFQGAQ